MKITCICLALALSLTSCDKPSSTAAPTAPSSGPSAALNQVLATLPAGEAKSITDVRGQAKPGDEITLHGRIMGNLKPFVEGRALFVLGDPGLLTPCNEIPGDECDTPWDVCCETPEDKKRGTATIQVVDADGRVLKESLQGVAGLDHLSHVTVTGKVAEGSSADLLLVNAKAIKVGK